MGTRKVVAILWIAFLVRGVFYCSLLPLWEGFDEWGHFAVVQKMATQNAWSADRSDVVSREVLDSLRLSPQPWDTRLTLAGVVTHDAFWKLAAAERLSREARLRSLAPELAREHPASGVLVYEAQQAPLYYWLLSLVYRPLAGIQLLTRVWLLRLATVAIASFTVPLTFKLARRVSGSQSFAAGVTAMVVSMPGLTMLCTRIGNEALAATLGTLSLLLMLECGDRNAPRRVPLLFGLAFGLALLTKAYFLALAPALLMYAAYTCLRGAGRLSAAVRWASAFAVALGIAGWWYWRTWQATGSFSGERNEAAALHADSARTLAGLLSAIHWRASIDFAFVTHVWVGNWSFLVLRDWMYRLLAWVAVVAVLGVLRVLIRPGDLRRSDVLGLALAFAAAVAALGYHIVMTFAVTGEGATLGYYLYGVIAAEAVLVAVGLAAFVPQRHVGTVAPGVALLFAALDLYGTLFCLMPYYTGTIVHSPAGKLDPAHGGDLARNAGLIFGRMAENKAGVLVPSSMLFLWILYVAATISTVVFAFRLGPRGDGAGR